jgi:hypothetical protein
MGDCGWEQQLQVEGNYMGNKMYGNAAEAHGRLVLIAERQLSEASRYTLRGLLEGFWKAKEEVTWVSGLSQASVLEAGKEAGEVFYNRREYFSMEQVVGLLPWKEVWLVSAGQVWKLEATRTGM